MRYLEKVGCRPDRMAAVRHLDKVERWPNRISDMRYPGGMRDSRPGGMRDSRPGGMRDSRPGGMRISRTDGMSDATCRKSDPTVDGCASNLGRFHNHQGKNCRVSLLKGLLQPRDEGEGEEGKCL